MKGIRGGNQGPDLGSEASSVDGRRKAPEAERMKGEGRMHTSQLAEVAQPARVLTLVRSLF